MAGARILGNYTPPAVPMIAFGTSITKPEVFRRCAEPGIRRAAEPGSGVLAGPGGRHDLPQLQRAARPRGAARRTSRRSCSSTRTPSSSTPTCARRCATRWPTPASGSSAASGRSACARSPGGRRRSRSRRSSTATRSTAAATCTRSPGTWDDAPPYAHTGEVETLDGFLLVLSPWAVREIRFDEGAGRVPRLRPGLLPPGARGRAQGGDRGPAGDPPPPAARWCPTRSAGSPRTSRSPRSGTGACRGIGTGPGSWRERALRAEAERDLALADRRTARRWRRARARAAAERALAETRRQPLLAPDRSAPAAGAGGRLIAFGSCIVDPAAYIRYARPGIEAAAEPARHGVRVRGRRQRLAQQQPAARRRGGASDDLEALVLVDEHVELDATRSCARWSARRFADPDVAVVGCMGATGRPHDRLVGGADQPRRRCASAITTTAAASCAAFGWATSTPPPADGRHGRRPAGRALAVGGAHAALRRGAEPRLRPRPRLLPAGARGRPHGRDRADRARPAPPPLELVPDRELWVEGHIRFAEKWDGRMPGDRPTTATGRRARAAPRPSATPPARSATRAPHASTPGSRRSSASWTR